MKVVLLKWVVNLIPEKTSDLICVIDYNIKISGKGCKHIIISPDGIKGNVIVPAGVSIHHPEDWTECDDLTIKLAGSYLR